MSKHPGALPGDPGQYGSDNDAPGSQKIVIGLELVPDPCAVNGDEIVPHRSTVTPGPISPAPDPQSDDELNQDAECAFAQLDPSFAPAALCAT